MGACVSLEPGGQLELSGAPFETIHQTRAELQRHLQQTGEVCKELGLAMLGLGFQPKWRREDIPFMPKGRYRIMREYMPKRGSLGLDMMLRTCTVQVNLDYVTEADMIRKFRVGLALQPIVTALFAASPFANGRPTEFQSLRGQVWLDTDPDRTGLLPFVFEEGFGFERYVDYALEVPMYFVYRDGRYIDASGQSFRDFLEGRLPALPSELPSLGDWNDHLTTLFPEVRLKKYLEMRGADSGPFERLCALPAFWTGILYDSVALDAGWDLVKDWSAEERARLRADVPRLGLRASFRNARTVRDVALAALDIAREGLRRRARRDGRCENEAHFLDTSFAIAGSGRSPADDLMEEFNTRWGRNIDRIFIDHAYAQSGER